MKKISKIIKINFYFKLILFANLTIIQAQARTLDRSCESKLFKGIKYSRLNSHGANELVELRFAPFRLSPFHAKKFNQFKVIFEKQSAYKQTKFQYEQLVCRYFFGSFLNTDLPENIDSIEKLLRECPLGLIDDVIIAEGPKADCAPAVVNCQRIKNNSPTHPLDKIACERVLKSN